MGDNAPQLAGLDVALDDDGGPVSLQPDSDGGRVPVEGKLARRPATGGNHLETGEGASLGINGEVDEGIGDDLGAVFGIEVGNLQGVFVAGGDDQELLIRLFWSMLVAEKRGDKINEVE